MDQFAAQLRQETAAVRLHRSRFGARKALDKSQKAQAASVFHAEADSLSASKKLLDTKDKRYQAVTAILSRAASLWKDCTVPYPEPGIRLIRKEQIERFNAQMIGLTAELDQATAALNESYHELRNKARTTLQDLFNAGDYPDSLDHEFAITWDFPSVEPPEYLKQLNPALYAAEEERIKRRFEEAVLMAEQSFVEEFSKLVGNLTDKLTGKDESGQPKTFRDSSVDKLHEFFERFKQLNVRSNPELDALVEQAQNCVAGTHPDQLRSNGNVRYVVGEALKQVNANLEGMMIKRPRRAISLHEEDE